MTQQAPAHRNAPTLGVVRIMGASSDNERDRYGRRGGRSPAALGLLDGLIYLDRKLIVSTGAASLHPSETHMLSCAMEGMSFTEIATRFGVTKAAVWRAFTTQEGEAVFEQARILRSQLSAALTSRLSSYDMDELATVERFARDLDDYISSTIAVAHRGATGDA